MSRSIPRLAVLLSLLVPGAAHAQEAPFNWMRDYVQQRVEARTAAALATRSGEGSGASKAAPGVPDGRIVGGGKADPLVHPFQVGLLTKSVTSNFDAQYCGGTLYKSTYVVTAAHCSDFVKAGDVQVLVGTQSLSSGGTRVNVKRISIHPRWNPRSFDYDVAVWELSSPVTGITLPSLVSADPPVGTPMTITGWGSLHDSASDYPTDLMQASVPMYSRTLCNSRVSYSGQISLRMICAGYQAGGVDTCQGDSGGPMTSGAGKNVLTGIVSWGNGCAKPNYPGVYTRVSDTSIRSFITSIAK